MLRHLLLVTLVLGGCAAPPDASSVVSSGTYRISELEKPVASGLHALKVPRDAQKDYWVEYRPAIATAATRDGVSINWG